MLNFMKCFSCVYGDDHLVFVLSFVDVLGHIDWYVHVESFLWDWGESNLIVVYALF